MKGGGVYTALVWGIAAPVAMALLLAGDRGGWLCAALVLPFMFPWFTARFVCVPLGAVRAAYLFGRVAEVFFAADRLGGALLAAAWATLARRDTAGVVWVERRLSRARSVGGAGVVASGLLAAATGDDAGARLVLSGVTIIDADELPRAAKGVAAEWLAADAAERGDWTAVRAPLARTRTTRFLATVACRLLGQAIDDRALRRAWWWAPRRTALRPLLERALATRPAPAAAANGAAAPAAAGSPYRDAVDDALLVRAVAAHARVVAAPAVTTAQLGEVARAWDEALAAPATRVVVEDRARVLGARAADALAKLAAGAAGDLAEVAWRAGLGLDGAEGGIAAAATARLRERVLVDVEAAARSLSARVQAGRTLPAATELRDVLALREHVARAGRLAGMNARRLLFEDVHAAVCPLACKLWNDREQRVVAGAMFRWLLSEAEAVGNARLAEHERRNVAAG